MSLFGCRIQNHHQFFESSSFFKKYFDQIVMQNKTRINRKNIFRILFLSLSLYITSFIYKLLICKNIDIT